jgi:hypothetical protein
MANTLKFGSGQWATKVGSTLAYNDEGGNFKPLPFNFTRSTGATRVNKDGLIEVVTNNKPRIDFLNDSNGALLLEPARTNLATYSEQFDNAAWGKLYITISPNTTDTIDPSGYYGADKIIDNATVSSHVVYQASQWDTTQRTASVYAKAGTSSKVSVLNISLGTGVFADLSAETIFVSAGFTGTLTSVGNGWFRITATHTAATPQTFSIGLFTGTNTNLYGGTGSYAYIWGAQVEAGSYATSYIPTQGATATRVADACSQTPPSGIIGQTEGTIFLEGNLTKNSTTGFLIQISDGTNNNRVQISFDNSLFWQVTGNNLLGMNGSFNFTDNNLIKIAFAYKNGDSIFYINGVEATSLGKTSVNVPLALNRIDFGRTHTSNFPITSKIKSTLLFKTRLTNAELATLTTL